MTTTTTTKTTVCDCCNTPIIPPSFITSSAPDPYFSKGSIDLCNICTLKISRKLLHNLSQDELIDIVDKNKSFKSYTSLGLVGGLDGTVLC